jgi:hypothetical protein
MSWYRQVERKPKAITTLLQFASCHSPSKKAPKKWRGSRSVRPPANKTNLNDADQVSRTFFTLPVSTSKLAPSGRPLATGLNLSARASVGHQDHHEDDAARTDFSSVPKWASKQSIGPLGLTSKTHFTCQFSLVVPLPMLIPDSVATPSLSFQRRSYATAQPKVQGAFPPEPPTEGSPWTPQVPN